MTDDENFVDLVWHELEFREGDSFTYVLRDPEGAYLGCLYLYPVGLRAPLAEDTIRFDVDVSWWVTPDGYERGYYGPWYEALGHWIGEALPFDAPLYSNVEIPAPAPPALDHDAMSSRSAEDGDRHGDGECRR